MRKRKPGELLNLAIELQNDGFLISTEGKKSVYVLWRNSQYDKESGPFRF